MGKLKRPSVCASATVGLMLFLVATVSGVRIQEDVEKKYASILGDYEFDLNAFGLGVMTVTFYVEGSDLLVVTEASSDPGKLEPIQGKEYAFIVEDPEEGTYRITFLKDDTGKYTKCHLVNENMNMDVMGQKIELSEFP